MKKLVFVIIVVLGFAVKSNAQGGIYNNGGYIVSNGSASYWVVSGGNFTLTSRSVDNLASMNNLTIALGASLTIDSQSFLTVSSAVTNSNTTGTVGLTVNSDATGTASLIAPLATGTGAAAAQRWMSAGAWHLVSAPVVQTVSSFLTANGNVATNGSARGMMDYIPASNNWNSFFLNGADHGNLGSGKGFSMRLAGLTPVTDDAAVTATGLLQAGAMSVSGLTAGKWNCVGNPYSSAIGINNSSSTGATNNFIAVNATNLDQNYEAIYVWHNLDANNGQPGNYTVINNTNPPYNDIQQGQAFMVLMDAGKTSVSFTPQMQFHGTALLLKSAQTPWSMIKLVASANSQTGSTLIAFNDGMTKGLDVTYDAGLLRGGSDVQVYTKLVEASGNTTPFAIQALPENNFNEMIIPVGVESKIGGEIIFSAETTDLPSNCKVILEDKLTKTFTDLSANVYKAAIMPNSTVADRFQLHTSTATIGAIGQSILSGKLNAFATGNTEIRVVGEVSGKAVATLYDVLGKAVLMQKLSEGTLNVIPLSNIKSGVYILSVEDKVKTSYKLRITE